MFPKKKKKKCEETGFGNAQRSGCEIFEICLSGQAADCGSLKPSCGEPSAIAAVSLRADNENAFICL